MLRNYADSQTAPRGLRVWIEPDVFSMSDEFEREYKKSMAEASVHLVRLVASQHTEDCWLLSLKADDMMRVLRCYFADLMLTRVLHEEVYARLGTYYSSKVAEAKTKLDRDVIECVDWRTSHTMAPISWEQERSQHDGPPLPAAVNGHSHGGGGGGGSDDDSDNDHDGRDGDGERDDAAASQRGRYRGGGRGGGSWAHGRSRDRSWHRGAGAGGSGGRGGVGGGGRGRGGSGGGGGGGGPGHWRGQWRGQGRGQGRGRGRGRGRGNGRGASYYY